MELINQCDDSQRSSELLLLTSLDERSSVPSVRHAASSPVCRKLEEPILVQP